MAATRSSGSAVRGALAAACGLLGVGGARAQATEVQTAVLGYYEPGRVTAFEGIVDASHTLLNGKTLTGHLVFDTLTGASANGAVPTGGIQTFTSPSGESNYQTEAGKTPLDSTFKDTRAALNLGLSTPFDRLTAWGAGVYFSGEHDYTSLGANTSLTRDFNRKNTTLALRASYYGDSISPVGGRPIPFAAMVAPDIAQPRQNGNGTKNTLDLTFGLTQALSRRTIFAVNFTHSRVRGYQTDPYKVLSLVDDVTGSPLDYLYESRPDARNKDMVFATLARHIGGDDVHLSYRYFTDDWGVASHTADFRYRWHAGSDWYLQPHVRYTRQTRADFYRRFLVSGEPLPETASADYRLADMKGWTAGLQYGRRLASGHDLTLRAEYFRQTNSGAGTTTFGDLAGYDLFPAVDAIILQVGYSLDLGVDGRSG